MTLHPDGAPGTRNHCPEVAGRAVAPRPASGNKDVRGMQTYVPSGKQLLRVPPRHVDSLELVSLLRLTGEDVPPTTLTRWPCSLNCVPAVSHPKARWKGKKRQRGGGLGTRGCSVGLWPVCKWTGSAQPAPAVHSPLAGGVPVWGTRARHKPKSGHVALSGRSVSVPPLRLRQGLPTQGRSV